MWVLEQLVRAGSAERVVHGSSGTAKRMWKGKNKQERGKKY